MSVRAHARALQGLVYLGVAALFVAACIATYAKALPWQRSATVQLVTAQTGLGLAPHSDVKFQGLLVGEVRSVVASGRSSTVELAIDRGLIDRIPADVDAMIVPKTLFGDKFVDLRRSTDDRVQDPSAGPRLTDGARIQQSTTSVEIGEIFDRLVPVLRGLQPARLSVVLTSLAEALDGRGQDIAETLTDTQVLLHRLAPSYDTLTTDLRLLAGTSDVYADASTDLLGILDDAAEVSRANLVPHEGDLRALLDAATRTAGLTEDVLRRNGEALVQVSGRARPVLEVLSYYSREVPCVLKALDYGNRLANLASGVRGPYIALTIDMIVDQEPYEYPDDLPSNPHGDASAGNLPAAVPGWEPHCPRLPDRVTRLGKTPPPYSQLPYAQTFGSRSDSSSPGAASPSATRDSRQALADSLAAQGLGVDPRRVPAYAGLLVLPLTADGTVEVR